jgi:hypothetical protein
MIAYTIERLHATMPPEHLETTVRDERAARVVAELTGLQTREAEAHVAVTIRCLSPGRVPSRTYKAMGGGYDAVRVTAESA